MSEKKLDRSQLLDEVIEVAASMEGDYSAEGLKEKSALLHAIVDKLDGDKPKVVWGNKSPSVKRVSKEEAEEWDDPYKTPPREHWLNKEYTPQELRDHAEKYRKLQEESRETARNMPRRVRMECFLTDWNLAIMEKKIPENEGMNEVIEQLMPKIENKFERAYFRSTIAGRGCLISDVKKIEEVYNENKDLFALCSLELIRTDANKSMSQEDIAQMNGDWEPGAELPEPPDSFGLVGIWEEEPTVKVKKEEEKEESDEFKRLVKALFDENASRELHINELARSLAKELDANPLAELDMKRMHLFKRLAKLTYEITDVTQELFKPRPETALEKERRLRREELMSQGTVLNRVEPQDEEAEEDSGWSTALGSLLVAAISTAAKSHFDKQAAKKEVEVEVNV